MTVRRPVPPDARPATAVPWVRLRLDVTRFVEEPHRWALERAAADGIVITTMAELGDDLAVRRALWRLDRDCSADIPGRAGFPSFEQYAAERLARRSYRPAGVVVAVAGEEWVAVSATTLRPDGDLGEGRYAFSEMTGVRRDHRGHGLGVAVKLHAIRFVRASRYRWLRTLHHPEATAAIAMNKRLGFTLPPGR